MSRHPTSRDAPDLIAVRNLPPGSGEPSAEAVARTWAAVARRQHGRRSAGRWWRARWRARWAAGPAPRRRVGPLVPVTVAALVVGLVLGASVLFTPGLSDWGPGGPGSGARSGHGDGGGPAADSGYGRAMSLSVAYRMRQILAAAERIQPMSLTGEQVVRVRVNGLRRVAGAASPTGVQGTVSPPGQLLVPHRYDLWVDDRLGIRGVEPDNDDGGYGTPTPSGRRPGESPAAPYPPGYVPAVLAGLDTDPGPLRNQLLVLFDDSTGWSEEHRLVAGVTDMFTVHDALLAPEIRVALYRLLASLDGMTARTVTVDGREFVGLRHIEADTAEELLFDPISGRTAGRQTIAVARNAAAGPGGLSPAGWDDVSIIYRYLWSDEVIPLPVD